MPEEGQQSGFGVGAGSLVVRAFWGNAGTACASQLRCSYTAEQTSPVLLPRMTRLHFLGTHGWLWGHAFLRQFSW